MLYALSAECFFGWMYHYQVMKGEESKKEEKKSPDIFMAAMVS